MLSTCDISPHRPIQKLFNPTSLEHTSLEKIPCVVSHILGFSLNSSPKLLPSLQKILNIDQNARSFNFLFTGFNIDNAFESDCTVNTYRSLSIGPAKKTKEIAIFDKPNLEIQLSTRVCLKGFYVHPIPVFRPDITYETSPVSFICSRLKLGFD